MRRRLGPFEMTVRGRAVSRGQGIRIAMDQVERSRDAGARRGRLTVPYPGAILKAEMQKDFHYYAIAVLARAAGFEPADALVLAYASQYVDDATEGGLIQLEAAGSGVQFDPVRTSYFGLEMLRSVTWRAQKRVWIPFHFLPPVPFDPALGGFSFVCRAGSPLGRMLLDRAAAEPMAHRRRRLCRIGVALHAYADGWSHEDFSGRMSREENDVEAIHVYDGTTRTWVHPKLENVVFDVLPFIGHGEAGYYPDLAFVRWRFTLGQPARRVERENTAWFLEAAENLYRRLRAMEKEGSGEVIPWEEIGPAMERLLRQEGEEPPLGSRLSPVAYQGFQALDVERRCENWKRAFDPLFAPEPYAYDRHAWRRQALEGDTEWDGYGLEEWGQMAPRRVRAGFWDSLWVHFHRAALRQRHLVLEGMP